MDRDISTQKYVETEWTTFGELSTAARAQQQSLFYRLLPSWLYQRLSNDELIDLQAAKNARDSVVAEIKKTIANAESTSWIYRTAIQNAQNNHTPYDLTTADAVTGVNGALAQIRRSREQIPDCLLTPIEHARLFELQNQLEAGLDSLRSAIRRRREAVDHIHGELTACRWQLLQTIPEIRHAQDQETFEQTIGASYQTLVETYARLERLHETYPVGVFTPAELSRLFVLQLEISKRRTALRTVLAQRREAIGQVKRVWNDVRQSRWDAAQYLGDGQRTPAFPNELEPVIERLQDDLDSLQTELETVDWALMTAAECGQFHAAFVDGITQLARLRQRRVFEQVFRDLRQQWASVYKNIQRYLETDIFWSEAERRRAKAQIQELRSQLEGVRVLEASFRQVSVEPDRVARVADELATVAAYEKFDLERFRELRADAVETVDKQLGDSETVYWKHHQQVDALLQLDRWDHTQRSKTVPNLMDTLRSEVETLAATMADIPAEALRPVEYGHLYSYRRGHEDDIEALSSRLDIERTLNTVEDICNRIESEAAAYLAYETLCPEATLRDLQADLTTAAEKLRMLQQSAVESSPATVEQRRRLASERVDELIEHFETYNRDYVARCAKQRLSRCTSAQEQLDARLAPSREEGEPLPDDIQAYEKKVRTAVEDLRDLKEGATERYLTDSLRHDIDQACSRLDRSQSFIKTKRQFETELAEHQTAVEAVASRAAPFLSFQRFLTRAARSEIIDSITETRTAIETWRDGFDFSLLAQADEQKVAKLIEQLVGIAMKIQDREEYNAEFVRKQRERCSTLFTGIGPSELDLTEEQERAIIRNGIYNQVVAAAGTGKTLALTTRVAYLIHEQGVDPSRILVVTYTNEATEEMQDRLAEHFDITGVEIRTVNSFGRKLLNEARDEYVETIDPLEKIHFIDRQIRKARSAEASEFIDHYYEFLVHFYDVYYTEEDFETKKEYVQARADQEYRTLKGNEVKSRAEKLIADFLYTHQVEYRYEDRATWVETASEKAGYTPDFYLPNDDIYIEHWGIDESGTVAPWFSQSSTEYRAKIRWARQQFANSKYTLIGTYEFEHEATRLKQALHHRLTHHGVDLDRMDFEELVENAFDYEQRERWIKRQFQSFIENAKRFEVMPDEIEATLSQDNPRQYHFGQCGIHLLQQYARYLMENGLIDFTDQINDAAELIRDNPGRYRDQYDHLLVDEFQDIGAGKIQLIQELTGPDGAKLFAVGDDWQSIYSFQGAAIEYFTEFSTHFAEPVRTDLTANFRSPPAVVEAGNNLIEQNTEQLSKTVRPMRESDAVPHVHTLRGYKFYDYVRRVRRYTVELVQEYLSAGAAPGEIMVLCRFDDAVPYLDEIKQGLRSQSIPYVGKSDQYHGPAAQAEDGVSVYSLYQAKGKEAAHVILVHAAEGPYGFPPDDRDNELLEPVQPLGTGGIEEERRAFYVAVTRARRSLDLLTRGGQESPFLDEIDDRTKLVETGQVEPLEAVGERMTVEVEVDQLLDPWTKQHQRGIVTDRYGGSARFVSWESNDPPTLEQGEWYEVAGVPVGEYKDEKELIVSDARSVSHLPDGPGELETAELPDMD